MGLTASDSVILHLYTDLNLKVLSGSGHAGLFGIATEDLSGAVLPDLFSQVAPELLEQVKHNCIQFPGKSQQLNMHVGVNGSARFLKWIVCSRQNLKGITDGLIWVGTENALPRHLQEEQMIQQSILDAITDSVVTMDDSFRITSINKKSEQVFGWQASKVIGSKVTDHFQMQMLNQDLKEAMQQLQQQGHWEGIYVFKKTGQEPIYLSGKMFRVERNGTIAGYVSIDRDVSEQTRLQEDNEQKDAERQMLEAIMNQSGTLSWVTDSDDRNVFMSRPFREAFGYPEEGSAPTLSEVLPGPKAQAYRADNQQVIADKKILHKLESCTAIDGTTRWYRTIKFPVVTKDDVHAGGFAYEITHEYNQEQELNFLKRRFEVAASITADIIVDWDITTDNLWRSDPTSNIAVHEQKARSINDRIKRIHPEDRRRFTSTLKKALKSDQRSWHCEYRYKMGTVQNGFKVLNEKAEILRDENGVAVRMISVVKDVTEKRRLEQELRLKEKAIVAATIEGQETERKELAGELHDNVGQVLAMCKLFVDIAADAVHHEYMDKCRDHLEKAMQEIRSLSHRLSPELLDRKGLPGAIASLAENINQTNKVTFELEVDPSLNTTELDKQVQTSAYRIVQELMNNILKHAMASKATLRLWIEKGNLLMRMVDDGKGFDPQKVKSGIGLRNISNRAEVAGGTVVVESVVGKGTRTQVVLPLVNLSMQA